MAFWKKFYRSKYTGAEIDAAVAKAGTVPDVSAADAGKALVVDEDGKIVAGEAGGAPVFLEFTKEEVDPGSYSYIITIANATAAIAAGAFMAKVTDDSGHLQYLPIVRFDSSNLWLYGIKFAGTPGTTTALLKATKVGDYFQFS